jgi:DNA-binding transcriptional LysR family regulator
MYDSRVRHAVAVARTGSFSAAADLLGVTQSATSKSVSELEKDLGYSLFHRTRRGAVPTEDGRDFIERATRLLSDWEEMLGGRKQRRDPYAGPLRVGVFPGSLELILSHPVLSLIEKHPEVRVTITGGNSEQGVQLLNRGDIDLALGMAAAFSHWPQFKCEPLGNIQMHAFVRHGHPILDKPEVEASDIVDFDFIAPSASEPYTSIIREMYVAHGFNPADKVHVVDFFPIVRRLVTKTDAIGFVAKQFTQREAFQRYFAPLKTPRIFPDTAACCATRARWPVSPAARALIALLKADTAWFIEPEQLPRRMNSG